jgi:hypothetical protein
VSAVLARGLIDIQAPPHFAIVVQLPRRSRLAT